MNHSSIRNSSGLRARTLSPRFGIAWTIDPKTVMRVNSGIFYEAPATNLWYNALSNNGSNQALPRNSVQTIRSRPLSRKCLTLSRADCAHA